MANKTTRRAARETSISAQDQPKSATSAAETKNGGPRVKKVAEEPKKKEPAPKAENEPKVRIFRVELLLGSKYTVRGKTFFKDRPVVVTDERILKELEVNSRFKLIGVAGGDK